MQMSLKECVERIMDVYPDMHPTHWISYQGMYFFNISSKYLDSDFASIDFHMVNPSDGGVSGSIPLDMLMQNEEIVALLKNPHKVDLNERGLEHSIKKNDSYLEHHGIKGQKWGVRRFQNEDGSLTAEGRERYGLKNKNKPNGPEGMDPVAAYYAAQFTGLALFCIGASVYANVKKNQNHKNWKQQNDEISEDYLSDISVIKDFSDNNKPKSIMGEHSREDDMAAVNPKYGQPIRGNTNNCVLCSATYDLRRRGYDVTAKLCTTGMYTDKVVKDMYVGAKVEDIGAYSWSSIYKKCEKKYPEGSRGIISVNCSFGGHAMAFEIVNGKMQIFDAQSSEKKDLRDSSFALFDPQNTRIVRLDDKAVNWAGASVACSELKSDWKKTIAKQKKENPTTEFEANSNKGTASGNRMSMNAKQIMAYKRAHPGTQLTDKEIWINLSGGAESNMNGRTVAHSGIKGQKWGVRRFQNEDGSLTAEGKERYGRMPEKKEKRPKPESATWKSKDARYLSDAELNRRNSRLQREEQYRRMTQSKTSKAGKWIAATAGTILVASAIGALKGKMQKNYKDVLDKYGPKAVSWVKRKAASVSAASIMAKSIKKT